MPEQQDVLAPTILGAVARSKVVTAVIVIGCAAIGLAYSFTRTPVATASASVVVAAPSTATGGTSDPNFIADQVAIIELPSTADAAATLLRKKDPQSTLTGKDVLGSQTILNGASSNLITVQFANRDPGLAQDGANSVVSAYSNLLASTASASLNQQVSRLTTEIDNLYRQLVSAGGPNTVNGGAIATSRTALIATRSQLIANGANSPTITNSSMAVLPTASRSLGVAAGLALGALVGLVIAVALAYGLALTRRKFTTRFQPEVMLQRPLLSDVPDFALEGLQSDVPAADAPQSSSAEAFRFVTAALDAQARSDGPLVLAVTGASSLDGKTSTAANLAVTFAHRGLRTVAVDADLEGQGLGFLLLGDDRHAVGLAEVLAGRSSLESALLSTSRGVDLQLLKVIPAGLLHGPQINDSVSVTGFSDVLTALAEHADVIVIDVPSPLQVAYSSSLLRAVGNCVVIVPHGTNPKKLGDMSQRLTSLAVDPIGYVYTKAPLRKELGQLSQYVTDRRRMPSMPEVRPRTKPRTQPAATGPAPTSSHVKVTETATAKPATGSVEESAARIAAAVSLESPSDPARMVRVDLLPTGVDTVQPSDDEDDDAPADNDSALTAGEELEEFGAEEFGADELGAEDSPQDTMLDTSVEPESPSVELEEFDDQPDNKGAWATARR